MPAFTFPRFGKRLYRLAVGAFFFLQGLIFSSWASRIPDIMQRFQLNEAELGGVLFALPVGQMLCMPLSGWLVSRLGSRCSLRLGASCYALTLLSLGYAPTIMTLSGALLVFGMASNLCNIAVNTQAVGVERLYHRSIMASFHGLWSLAGFTGGVVGAVFAWWNIAPGPHFVVVALCCLGAIGGAGRVLLPRDHRDTSCPAAEPAVTGARAGVFRRIWNRLRHADATVLLLGVVAFGCMSAEGTMFDWSSVYYEVIIQPGPELVRLGYITFMSTMVCGRFLADGLITRLGVIRVLEGSGLLIAAGLLTAVLWPAVLPASVGLALVGFGTAGVVPICYSLAGKTTRMHPGVAVTVVSSIGFMGFLLGPPCIGIVAELTSLRWSFALISLFGLLTAGVGRRLGEVMR